MSACASVLGYIYIIYILYCESFVWAGNKKFDIICKKEMIL